MLQNGEETSGTAGMEEENTIRLSKRAFFCHGHESGKSFAGIDGIQKYALIFGHEPDRGVSFV